MRLRTEVQVHGMTDRIYIYICNAVLFAVIVITFGQSLQIGIGPLYLHTEFEAI